MSSRNARFDVVTRTATLWFAGLALVGCAGGADDAEMASEEADAMTDTMDQTDRRVVQHLEAGHPVFALFSGEHTAEGGAAMAETRPLDFVFSSLESGPFDVPALETYRDAMAEASGDRGTHPIVLRIPPIRDGHEEARDRVRQVLDAGVAGIVYPHVETPEEAALAVDALGEAAWPGNPDGHLFSLLLIEDQMGIDNVREIAQTPGVSAISPGPGDLRRVYGGDMEKVEEAIQTVLAACLEFDVPCGITAGVDDIAMRLDQGFRVIIVTQPDAVAIGMAHAGR